MNFIGSFRLGVVFASLAAGPLVLVSILCAVAATNPQAILSLGTEQTAFFMGIFLVSIPAGFLPSAVPILPCTALMFWLGRLSPDLRSPVFWAGVGALLPGATLVLLGIAIGGPDRPLAVLLEPTPIVMVPGALCALIARARTEWREPDVAERKADQCRQ